MPSIEEESTRDQIARFIRENAETFKADALGYEGLELTVATDDTWSEWGFQTGYPSFRGACYFFPHWAVVTFSGEETPEDVDAIVEEVLNQLDELTCDLVSEVV